MNVKDIFLVVIMGNIITFLIFLIVFSIDLLIGILMLSNLTLLGCIYLELGKRRGIKNAKRI